MVFPTWTITIEFFLEMDHWYQWFSNGFLEFWCNGQRWFWPQKKPKIARKLWHILFCYHCAYYFRIREHKMLHFTIPHHVSLPILKLQGVSCSLSTLFCYHCWIAMVFKGTITIEWNGWGQPLGSMVFRWFWGKVTIGNDGFRWLCTIGPTMEWLWQEIRWG